MCQSVLLGYLVESFTTADDVLNSSHITINETTRQAEYTAGNAYLYAAGKNAQQRARVLTLVPLC